MKHPFDRFAASYGLIKCVPKNSGPTRYLGASAANYVSLVANAGDGIKCMWLRDSRGQLWLSASLTEYRYMGWAEQDYADWGLGQGPGVGPYSLPLLYNSDGTVSLASQPAQQLYNYDDWGAWGVGRDDALVLTPAPSV